MEHNIEGVGAQSWKLLMDHFSLAQSTEKKRRGRRSYDALISGPDHLEAEQERRDLDVPDCKTDQNAITTCFERLFMSCPRGLTDLVPAKCNHYTNKR